MTSGETRSPSVTSRERPPPRSGHRRTRCIGSRWKRDVCDSAVGLDGDRLATSEGSSQSPDERLSVPLPPARRGLDVDRWSELDPRDHPVGRCALESDGFAPLVASGAEGVVVATSAGRPLRDLVRRIALGPLATERVPGRLRPRRPRRQLNRLRRDWGVDKRRLCPSGGALVGRRPALAEGADPAAELGIGLREPAFSNAVTLMVGEHGMIAVGIGDSPGAGPVVAIARWPALAAAPDLPTPRGDDLRRREWRPAAERDPHRRRSSARRGPRWLGHNRLGLDRRPALDCARPLRGHPEWTGPGPPPARRSAHIRREDDLVRPGREPTDRCPSRHMRYEAGSRFDRGRGRGRT